MGAKVRPAAVDPPTAKPDTTLFSGFARSVSRFPGRPALEVGNYALSYAELDDRAARIAASICKRTPDHSPPLTAIFAARSPTAFAGALGALRAGNGYVPINPSFPPHRGREILLRSGAGTLVVDAGSAARLAEVLEGIAEPPAVIAPDDAGEEPDRRSTLSLHRRTHSHTSCSPRGALVNPKPSALPTTTSSPS